MEPLASVIVPNLNGAAVIGRCLEHLLAQTYPRVEIIVVDDSSTDDSGARADAFAARADLTVLRQPATHGLAAARNLGVRHARGEVIAFIDTDGYAHPEWLATAIHALEADASIGAVAPLVFFDDHRLILNGAGGTFNYRGYAIDHAFDAPYEFATIPDEVLYPMGCGMVVRRPVMDAVAPLDEAVTNYYDDVELGIRVWAQGARVVVCPGACVDHGFGGSGPHAQRKLVLGERHRIRTALKYFPAGHLAAWLAHEARLLDHLRSPGRRAVPFDAWRWNLRALRSARAIRRRFAAAHRRFWRLVLPAWRLPPRGPDNRTFRPDPAAAGSQLVLDGAADAAQLNFGWYAVDRAAAYAFRPSAPDASAFVRLPRSIEACTLIWRGAPAVEEATLTVRLLGEVTAAWQVALAPPPQAWEQRRLACRLGPGTYEVVLRTAPRWVDAAERERGADVAAISFGPHR